MRMILRVQKSFIKSLVLSWVLSHWIQLRRRQIFALGGEIATDSDGDGGTIINTPSDVKGEQDVHFSDEQLAAMSDDELEEICFSRGFELVREEVKEGTQPPIYTHEDYIDAARQCLQIEQEIIPQPPASLHSSSNPSRLQCMGYHTNNNDNNNVTYCGAQHHFWMNVFHDFAVRNEVLRDNPEILDQLQAEAERMQKEKERLEAQKRHLEEELAKASEMHHSAGEEERRSGAFGFPNDLESECVQLDETNSDDNQTEKANGCDTLKSQTDIDSVDKRRPTVGDADYVLEPNMTIREFFYEMGLQIKKDILMVASPFRIVWNHPVTQQARTNVLKNIHEVSKHPMVQAVRTKIRESTKLLLAHPAARSLKESVAHTLMQLQKYAAQVVMPQVRPQKEEKLSSTVQIQDSNST